MVTGQAKIDLMLGNSQSASVTATSKPEAEIIAYIQKAFSDKNSKMLQLERQERQLAQSLARAQSETAKILTELHKTQELLEQSRRLAATSEEQITRQQIRISKLKPLVPALCEMEVDTIKVIKKGAAQIVHWHVSNVYIEDEFFHSIQFDTHTANGRVGFVIKQPAQAAGKDAVIAKPYISAPQGVKIFPEAGPSNAGKNREISNLGTTDWSRSKALIMHVATYLQNPKNIDGKFKNIDVPRLQSALSTLHSTLSDWPRVCRFDRIKLKDTLQTHEYHRLALSLSNFSVGSHRWPKLDYNLATVDEGGTFGQNPRLEFPEDSKDVIKNWFAESSDGRGARLELRFAKPDAFDLSVWSRLSNIDQLLIAALIGSLPAQISTIKHENTQINNWEQWQALSETMATILANQFRAVRNTE